MVPVIIWAKNFRSCRSFTMFLAENVGLLPVVRSSFLIESIRK